MRPTGRTIPRTSLWVLLLALACGDDPVAPVPTTIAISPASVTLQSIGETAQLSAAVQDQNGRSMSGITVTWASGNRSVATVDAGGLVTATGNGTATIEASVDGLSGSLRVAVEQRLADVTVSPDGWTLRALGATIRMGAEAVDANGHVIEGVEFTWSSGDESVATIDGAGLVTAIANGVAVVEASVEGTVGTAQVTVEQRAAEVWVSPDKATLAVASETIRLSAGAADANGHVIEGAKFTWSSDAEDVVTVDADGLVTAIGNGVAEVGAALEPVAGFATVRVELDRVGLLKFYEAMGGPGWHRDDNWGTDAPLGTWFGLLLDRWGGVYWIAMGGNGLTGSIPVETARLRTLRMLFLPGNSITGPIPAELGDFERLQSLDISGNQLTGAVPPELGGLQQLANLILSGNRLTGSIPVELGDLESLVYMNFSDNQLTGAIPSELGNLQLLRHLDLSGNQLTGTIPSELGDLRDYLEHIDLSDNQLTGAIPPELGRLRDFLKDLDLSDNRLTGALPPELGGIRFLKSLRVNNTDLSGRIPLELTNLSLEVFTWDGTDLCAPDDEEFQEWLKSIPTTSGPDC